MNFLQSKGINAGTLTDDALLMQHIQSVDFMELIVVAEMEMGRDLDLESVQIEQIGSLGGFVSWLEQA